MSISQSVQDAINKELPSMVAGELRDYIAQAEQWKRDSASRADQVTALMAELSATKAKLDELKQLKLDSEALDKRKLELDEQQREMKVVMAELKVHEAISRSNDIFNLVDRLFRNVEVKRSLAGNMPYYTPPTGQGSGGFIGQQNVQTTTTETQE